MQQILSQRRECKQTINFRDDLSEYSSPSTWGDRSGPLSLCDHQIAPEGLQARRTAGEAVLHAQWDAQWERHCEASTDSCRCLSQRRARLCLGAVALGLTGLRLKALQHMQSRPVVFTWAEVQSFILLPSEGRGPCLIAVGTFRLRDDGSREWLLQAAGLRSRAQWALRMVAAVLRDRRGDLGGPGIGGGGCKCCGSSRSSRMSTALYMDMVRITCEVARTRPSAKGMEGLVEVLNLMTESSWEGQSPGMAILESPVASAPHFPMAALRRFSDSVRRAHSDFLNWQQWLEVALLLRPPGPLGVDLWCSKLLPFLCPQNPALRDTADPSVYPSAVAAQLAAAAERCRRTLS